MVDWAPIQALIYTGDTIGADEAFRLGLVNKVFPKADLHSEVTKLAKRMSRVSLECLQWNKRAINHTFETMGLRNAIQYGSEASALMDSIGSPEADQFDSLRREKGGSCRAEMAPRPVCALRIGEDMSRHDRLAVWCVQM